MSKRKKDRHLLVCKLFEILWTILGSLLDITYIISVIAILLLEIPLTIIRIIKCRIEKIVK